jgi:hypothetical protein
MCSFWPTLAPHCVLDGYPAPAFALSSPTAGPLREEAKKLAKIQLFRTCEVYHFLA